MLEEIEPKKGEPGWSSWNHLREYMDDDSRKALPSIVQKGIKFAMDFLTVEEEDPDFDELVAKCYESILSRVFRICLTADAKFGSWWHPDPKSGTPRACLYSFSIADSELRLQIEAQFADWYGRSERRDYLA